MLEGRIGLGRLNRFLNRPYYVYRPSQLLRRARLAGTKPGLATVNLPWGMDITVDPKEDLGGAVVRNAVYEISVSEILHRLCDRGDLAIDVGANIGYMTSILAARVGGQGEVLAFEPHPALFARLARNIEQWKTTVPYLPAITALEIALSDRSGKGRLSVPSGFELNMGLAALVDGGDENGIEVNVGQLDEIVPSVSSVGVVKLDVEGHEAGVLAGGRRMLYEHRIRDLVFEEHRGYPSKATALLERAGYTILGIEQHLRGVVLTAPHDARTPNDGAPRNFVASCQPERLIRRLSPGGWRVLRDR